MVRGQLQTLYRLGVLSVSQSELKHAGITNPVVLSILSKDSLPAFYASNLLPMVTIVWSVNFLNKTAP